ncbi:flagella basal body P-ring formation protein FlgA [Rhodobacter sp. TJ_12]|uniref:flagellar basal body P-ring formation chaperone FlgA n=1 Tax=Rhodobacter sp. TJ_12 TaxID=2029399 RepID=UPI001CC163DE|nr:flagellar basal body P-ring formation chaperone FlgA [Rhodobacter sp. TJ_12]MBZ4022012.1 flagella basal body P-ring formation protein FlgA [Rhodobacter sp. TJ_12]
MKPFALAICALLAGATLAEAGSVVSVRTLRAQSVLSPDDLALIEEEVPGALENVDQAIGLETRVTIYPGRPIRAGDLAPPALVERNQMIPIAYQRGGLSIQTEGRALDRGAIGEAIRVMNMASKTTVFATIGADGVAYVQH